MTNIQKAVLELHVVNFFAEYAPPGTLAPIAARGRLGDTIAQAPAQSRECLVAKLEAALTYAKCPERFEEEACLDILLSAARDWQDLREARLAA